MREKIKLDDIGVTGAFTRNSDRESRGIFCYSEVFLKTRFCQYIVGFPGRSCVTFGGQIQKVAGEF